MTAITVEYRPDHDVTIGLVFRARMTDPGLAPALLEADALSAELKQLCATTCHMSDHLWLHFARHGPDITPPIITRGEGVKIFDDAGKSYLDGLSGLFTVQVGHGRAELAEAAARQAETLAFFPLWGYATPPAIELSERLARYAPGDLNRVFFTSGGTEAVETAWKVAKQYFKLTGKPGKHKVISRAVAYHGTTQGALAITGLPKYKAPFEPVTPGGFRVPNTNFYRAPEPFGADIKAFGQWAADRIAEAIEFEGPDTVAAVFLEPVQNAGGSIPPPPGISSGSARSATTTTCCWSPTR